MKKLEDYTFEELRDEMAGRVMDGLLVSGGKGLKSELYLAMDMTLRWNGAVEEKLKLAKKKK